MPISSAWSATPPEYRSALEYVAVEHESAYAATYAPGPDGRVAVVLNTLVVTTETAPFVAAWAASLREEGRHLLAILDAEALARAGEQRMAG